MWSNQIRPEAPRALSTMLSMNTRGANEIASYWLVHDEHVIGFLIRENVREVLQHLVCEANYNRLWRYRVWTEGENVVSGGG